MKNNNLKSEMKAAVGTVAKAFGILGIALGLFITLGLLLTLSTRPANAAAITVPSQATRYPLLATGQFTNAPGGLLTNGVTFTVRGGTTTNINSAWVRLFKGRGLAIFPSFVGNAAGAVSNKIYKFNLTPDTNLVPTTVTPLSYTVAGNGTTGVVGYTNFFPDTLDNAYAIQLASIQSLDLAGTNITQTNITWVVLQ